MHYDLSLIETSTINIDGKKITYQKIPTGMSGPNGRLMVDADEEYDKNGFDRIIAKELEDYMNDGEEPDSEEVRAIKDEIERDQCENFLETLSVEADWEEEV